jgi:hypothetical protein
MLLLTFIIGSYTVNETVTITINISSLHLLCINIQCPTHRPTFPGGLVKTKKRAFLPPHSKLNYYPIYGTMN